MLSFAEIAFALEGKQSPAQGGPKGGGKGPNQQRRTAASPQQRELKALADFFEQLTKDVEREGTNTIVVEQRDGDYSAVVTIFDA